MMYILFPFFFITVWKDKKIGSAEIPLLMLLNHGFESSARVPIEIMNTANRLVGTGELEVFMRYVALFLFGFSTSRIYVLNPPPSVYSFTCIQLLCNI